MSVVVDASLLVAALVDSGAGGSWAEAILSRGSLCAPELVCVETADVLRRLERNRRITHAEAHAAYEDLLQLDLDLFPYRPFAERIWALRQNLGGCDAWYVALAESLMLPLATLDAKLAQARGPTCRFLTLQDS